MVSKCAHEESEIICSCGINHLTELEFEYCNCLMVFTPGGIFPAGAPWLLRLFCGCPVTSGHVLLRPFSDRSVTSGQ